VGDTFYHIFFAGYHIPGKSPVLNSGQSSPCILFPFYKKTQVVFHKSSGGGFGGPSVDDAA